MNAPVTTFRCEKCQADVRWISVIGDHAKGCPVRTPDPRSDREKARALAVEYAASSAHDPRAAETARLLKLV